MPRHKSAQNCLILPWLSGRTDCRDGRFLQVGNSLLLAAQFQTLSSGAQILYLCMALESGGKRDFLFPQSSAKKYGISPRSLWRYVNELERSGFIERVSLKNLRAPNEYRFSLIWKNA